LEFAEEFFGLGPTRKYWEMVRFDKVTALVPVP